MNPFLKVLHIGSWVILAVMKLFFGWIVGPIVIPFGLLWSQGDYDRWPKILYPWGNDEDQFGPAWWAIKHPKWPNWFLRYTWLLRNPVNNHRYLFKDRKPKIETNAPAGLEAEQLIAQGLRSGYRWAWSGPFAGYRKVWLETDGTYSERWYGWKVGSSVPGMGFTVQRRSHREIGK